MSRSQTVISLWSNGQMPNDLQNRSIQEKIEVGNDGILRISNIVFPTLSVYVPTTPNGAAVMICPGGGYAIEASGHEGVDVAKWFNSIGVTAFVLKYRLPDDKLWSNKHEVALQDALQGIKIIRESADKYNIDPNRIGIMGFSAGGHLAATVSTLWHQAKELKGFENLSDTQVCKPNFSILMYPVITSGPFKHAGSFERLFGKTPSQEQLEHYSAEKQVSAQTPPTLLVHATDDKGVPVENSMLYYDALRKLRIPASMLLYENGGHGFGLAKKLKGSVHSWPESCHQWLVGMGYIQ
ncbi:alpha/beta hydrolase [Runella salmonicolor]|uniref:Alpha/beta hydrolase n=1 Tax=Runella salmonicolor TaxID=2950278 RepID=A0ABT1FGS8_9BACT|nr:alpha/beta hydrolase [Runella salmonicolor]MCP1380919.1 alpha/beta hydrolase [Runella salmonicolor]